jgi:hypothetical protein
MNERIKLLAEQATTIIEATEYSGEGWIFNKEKFAELIVRECIRIVNPTQHHEVWAQSYLGGVDGLELLEDKVKKIKEHFGVEE